MHQCPSSLVSNREAAWSFRFSVLEFKCTILEAELCSLNTAVGGLMIGDATVTRFKWRTLLQRRELQNGRNEVIFSLMVFLGPSLGTRSLVFGDGKMLHKILRF